MFFFVFFFSSRRRHTRWNCDWSSDVCSSDLWPAAELVVAGLLVLLGTMVIWRYVRGRWHMHVHAHTAAAPHFHLHSHGADPSHGHAHVLGDARRSLGFGVAHGLAGRGAIA